MSWNLAVMLRESARAKPDHVAVILDQFKLTYRQLDAASDQVGRRLREEGIQPGDRVCLMVPNVPQFAIAYYGILKAGAVVVPMNVLLKAPEVAYFLSDSEATSIIVWEDFAGEVIKAMPEVSAVTVYAVLNPGSSSPPEGARSFAELLRGSPSFPMVETGPHDTAVILYTSGTTGRPKGAELTHFNLFMSCEVGATRLIEVRDDDVY